MKHKEEAISNKTFRPGLKRSSRPPSSATRKGNYNVSIARREKKRQGLLRVIPGYKTPKEGINAICFLRLTIEARHFPPSYVKVKNGRMVKTSKLT